MEQTKTILIKVALRNIAKARFALFCLARFALFCLIFVLKVLIVKVSIQVTNSDMSSAKQNTKHLHVLYKLITFKILPVF